MTLNHVLVREVFRDDADRGDFVAGLARLVRTARRPAYAWVLRPDHARRLLGAGPRPSAWVMYTHRSWGERDEDT